MSFETLGNLKSKLGHTLLHRPENRLKVFNSGFPGSYGLGRRVGLLNLDDCPNKEEKFVNDLKTYLKIGFVRHIRPSDRYRAHRSLEEGIYLTVDHARALLDCNRLRFHST